MTFLKTIAAWCGWALLAYICFVTLSPIEQRPHIGGVLFERVVAFGLVGFLLAIAYQKQGVRLFVFVAAIVVVLELAQLFVPGRHAGIPDVIEKIAGGALGVAAALLVARVVQSWSNPK